MNSLLNFIGKYSNLLVFLLLEVVAFLLIGNFNDYPHSKFISTSNKIAGWQNEQVTNARNYFALNAINETLAIENAHLRSQLSRYENVQSQLPYSPTPLLQYIPAKVIGMTLFENHNYLTINCGEVDSIEIGQGVRNNQGAVGVVCTVNKHYAVVLPIIHVESNISCRFLKNDYLGTIGWKGGNPNYAFLEDVAAHIPVCVGDTLVTSGLTPSFPEGIPVGIVEKASLQPGDSYFTIRVKLATDFRKIKYVEVIRTIPVEPIDKRTNDVE